MSFFIIFNSSNLFNVCESSLFIFLLIHSNLLLFMGVILSQNSMQRYSDFYLFSKCPPLIFFPWSNYTDCPARSPILAPDSPQTPSDSSNDCAYVQVSVLVAGIEWIPLMTVEVILVNVSWLVCTRSYFHRNTGSPSPLSLHPQAAKIGIRSHSPLLLPTSPEF